MFTLIVELDLSFCSKQAIPTANPPATPRRWEVVAFANADLICALASAVGLCDLIPVWM
jgi:hypothetical protein